MRGIESKERKIYMRVGILQPSYLPWLGYFDQMARVDVFVFLDDVQYTRRDWRNRNKIRTKEGWSWLTVPVDQKSKRDQLLSETRIDNSVGWRRKHRETIRMNYANAPWFDEYYPYLDSVYSREWDYLGDLCLETTMHFQKVLNIETPTRLGSELKLTETKADRIVALCDCLEATHYLSGDAGKDYLAEEAFSQRGMTLEFQEYDHPEYEQRFSGFVPYLSIIDLLFNCGDKSPDILTRMKPEDCDSVLID